MCIAVLIKSGNTRADIKETVLSDCRLLMPFVHDLQRDTTPVTGRERTCYPSLPPYLVYLGHTKNGRIRLLPLCVPDVAHHTVRGLTAPARSEQTHSACPSSAPHVLYKERLLCAGEGQAYWWQRGGVVSDSDSDYSVY